MKKISRETIFLLILGAFFLLVYSWLALATPPRFNSPDETANYFWLSRVAIGQELQVKELFSAAAGSAIHLRSDNINAAGNIVPGGFLGLILLYGYIAKIFGLWLFKFLTPFFAVLGGWCFYGLVKKVFDRRTALISLILLFVNPAWWYYASRGLLPNVLFVSLLLIGAWTTLGNYELRITNYELKTVKYLIGGLFVGLALMVRTSEIIWVSGVAVILIIAYWRKVNWFGLVWFVLAGAAVFIPVLFLNQSLYGSYFSFGYSQLGGGVASIVAVSRWQEISSLILPFGFHPRAVSINFWHYYIVMMWWYLIPVTAGLIWFFIAAVRSLVTQRFKGLTVQQFNQWVYFFIFVFVGVWLKIYYGSWLVKDNISGHYTIGVSYLRYWLPAIVLDLPLIAWLISKALDQWSEKKERIVVGVIILSLMAGLSARLVLTSEEGLFSVRDNLVKYERINQAARDRLELNAVIISDRSDKVFYPEFRVATFLGDFSTFEKLGKTLRWIPVYYYSHNQLTPANWQYLNDHLKPLGLELNMGESLIGEDGIYQLKMTNIQAPMTNN
ncbi:MAG: hypothetical protein WCT37_01195 [Patescibacteria group bacterium]|jgi:hypothetical protein